MATPKKGMKTTTAPAPTAMTKKPVAPPITMTGIARSTPTVAPRKAVETKARAVATPVTQRVKSRMLQNKMNKLGILRVPEIMAGKKK